MYAIVIPHDTKLIYTLRNRVIYGDWKEIFGFSDQIYISVSMSFHKPDILFKSIHESMWTEDIELTSTD